MGQRHQLFVIARINGTYQVCDVAVTNIVKYSDRLVI